MVEIMDQIRNFFSQVSIAFAELWFWPVVLLGLMILAVIFLAFLTKFSYENRILKSVNKLNKYFLSKPFITEENLVEFNLKMKKVPKVLRTNWQIYMLNREDTPTKYINVNTCIDKPLRTSSIEKNMSNFSVFTVLLAFLSFVIGLEYSIVLERYELADVLFTSCLVPFLIVFIYTIVILAVRASKNDIYACLYENFPLYERNLTKAVTTLPSYVDYEILFTKQEIKEGIPILQQYLEKRALVEQQELEKARENSVATEEYDFSDLGIDGSLILERSMKESEIFIKIKKRLEDEIGSIEGEQENYRKNYEETIKDMQRKLQASRENLESLKTQMEASTNRIESNYIRKQQADEIKKQQQLEKDIEEANAKFNDEQTSLQQEIDKRNKEIEEKREFVEHAMLLEFKHYANTLYKALTQKATEVGNQKLLTLAQENSDLKALLNDIQGISSEVDDSKNLIQNDDLTAENLYDLTNSDMEDLQDSRESSKQSEIEEDKKIEEKKETEANLEKSEEQNSSEEEVGEEVSQEQEIEGQKEDVSEEKQEEDESSDAEKVEDVESEKGEQEEIKEKESEDNQEERDEEEKEEEPKEKKSKKSDEDDKKNTRDEDDEQKRDDDKKSSRYDDEEEDRRSSRYDDDEDDGRRRRARYEDDYYDDDRRGRGRDRRDDNVDNYNYGGGYDNYNNYQGYDPNYQGGYPTYDANGYYDPNYQAGYQGYDPNYQGGYQDPYGNGYYYNDGYVNYGNGYDYNQYQQPNNPNVSQVMPGQQMQQQVPQNTEQAPTVQQAGGASDVSQQATSDAVQQTKNDDLDAIQKQIEEENNKLQKEKQEFETNINDTLSKIDSQDKEKPAKKTSTKKTVKSSSKKSSEQKQDEDAIKEISTLAKPRKERATSRRTTRGRKPQSRATSKKNISEIDELNQEMQKLLDSTKNS